MELWDDVTSEYREMTPTSRERWEEAQDHVPKGVASTFRAFDPHPLVIESATGAYFQDVDGNSYVDFDMNNGAGMSGHAHPAITEAVTDQLERGTLFTHPHELLAEAAAALKERWAAIDKVRFTNSGTESTMHAIRIARAHSGKDKLLKIEGTYHGCHDYVLISKAADGRLLGHRERPSRIVESDGIPSDVAETVEVAPWNDLAAVEGILEDNIDEIGALIVEPIVMNFGVTEPSEAFLQGLRELCDEYGITYIFDEVKTGVKVAPGGAAEYYGVEPDLVTLAKSIGGNFPVGAVGGREEVMARLEDGTAHYGTYNGNPLVLKALVTQLREVLTEDAYDHVDRLGERMARGYEDVMADAGVAGHVDHVNSQGSIQFTEQRIEDYRDWIEHIDYELHENYWLSMVTQGVIPHPHSADQQWTISVQHTEEHVDEAIEAFKRVAPRLAEAQQA